VKFLRQPIRRALVVFTFCYSLTSYTALVCHAQRSRLSR